MTIEFAFGILTGLILIVLFRLFDPRRHHPHDDRATWRVRTPNDGSNPPLIDKLWADRKEPRDLTSELDSPRPPECR
jgi:hypothetical protein